MNAKCRAGTQAQGPHCYVHFLTQGVHLPLPVTPDQGVQARMKGHQGQPPPQGWANGDWGLLVGWLTKAGPGSQITNKRANDTGLETN